MSYNLYGDKYLNKETLLQNDEFLSDARTFLIKRGGYSADDVRDKEDVYAGFLEHFRYQNVNEVTATRDLFYAQSDDTTDKEKEGMGKLMDTFDKMDTEFGLAAAQDYLGGVLFAPSTYAGMFSFGAGKAGALAAQQGIKFGIKQALKGGAKTAIGSAAVDAPIAAGTALAQEQVRVETDVKDEIDYTNVGLATALSIAAPATIGLATGTKRELTTNTAEKIRQVALSKEKRPILTAHKATKKVLNSTERETAGVRKDAKKFIAKLALSDTVPEQLKAGKIIKEGLGDGDKIIGGLDKQVHENIAVAAARILDKVPPIREVVGKKQVLKEERIGSRITRGIIDGHITEEEIARITKQHYTTMSQIGALIAEDYSEAGAKLGSLGRAAKKEKKIMLDELTVLDQRLQGLADATTRSRISVRHAGSASVGTKAGSVFRNWFSLGNINKARIGMMTVQLATTARNTTNGLMRNYVYAFDNLGAGLVNAGLGGIKALSDITKGQMSDEALRSLRLGQAQMRSGGQALYAKDLWLGTSSFETQALDMLFTDSRFGKTPLAKELFRSLGDVGDLTGAEGGLISVARKFNVLNTMSDNMFKRAIFSREIDKYLVANGQKGGLRGFFKEAYLDPETSATASGRFSQIDDRAIGEAMETALGFTYQTGKFAGKEGVFNKGFDAFIDLSTKTPITVGIPFPRYIVNQLIFAYEHMPMLGLFNLGGILNKAGKKGTQEFLPFESADVFAERMGKQVGGLATLTAMFGIRTMFGDETTGPYQYKDPTTNKTINAEANLGPFMGFAMLADLIYRHSGPNKKPLFGFVDLPQLHDNDKVAVDIPYPTRDIAKAFSGGTARAGLGLETFDFFSELALNFEEGGTSQRTFEEEFANAVGNLFNTFTVGAGMFKDLAGTFMGPEYRIVPDNTDVDLVELAFKQSMRSFPQEVNIDEGDVPLYSVGRSGPVVNVNPFLKAVTGITMERERTLLQEELDRLRFSYAELSPARIKLNKPLTNLAKKELGEKIDANVATFIQDPDYTSLPNDVVKRIALSQFIKNERRQARADVLEMEYPSGQDIAQKAETLFRALKGDRKTIVEQIYKQKTNGVSIHQTGHYEYGLAIYEDEFGEGKIDMRNELEPVIR